VMGGWSLLELKMELGYLGQRWVLNSFCAWPWGDVYCWGSGQGRVCFKPEPVPRPVNRASAITAEFSSGRKAAEVGRVGG
jgi:hypothetical protein